ncbi:MAG: hypothetical protein ACOX4I_00130 [Anaerovoracaceae bacterium]|jgi:amino acid transporter
MIVTDARLWIVLAIGTVAFALIIFARRRNRKPFAWYDDLVILRTMAFLVICWPVFGIMALVLQHVNTGMNPNLIFAIALAVIWVVVRVGINRWCPAIAARLFADDEQE